MVRQAQYNGLLLVCQVSYCLLVFTILGSPIFGRLGSGTTSNSRELAERHSEGPGMPTVGPKSTEEHRNGGGGPAPGAVLLASSGGLQAEQAGVVCLDPGITVHGWAGAVQVGVSNP